MDKIVVLIGQTGSGKTTLAKKLEECGYERIVTYTTRKPRKNEVDGVDYHFISEAEFLSMAEKEEFAEYTKYNATFGQVYYGSAKKDYLSGGEKVIVLNPDGLEMIQRNLIPNFSVLLDIPKEELIRRTTNRGDAREEILRRLSDDEKKFENIKSKVDLILGEDKVGKLVCKILSS